MRKLLIWAPLVTIAMVFVACGGSPAAPAPSASEGESSAPAEAAPEKSVKVAPASGKFENSGFMTDARQTAVALRLTDGRVFVAGGRGKGSEGRRPPRLETATIWEPATGEWIDVAIMVKEREEATAHLLQDGRVMVVGGRDQQKYHKANEIYDVGTDTWIMGPRMDKKRFDHASALLNDGTVLVSGGSDSFQKPFDSVELCDPAAENCTAAGTMSAERTQHTMTTLPDGRVLIAGGSRGGIGTEAAPYDSADIYDPETGEVSALPSMPAGHTRHTATLLKDGRVLVTGGTGKTEAADLFDPATDTWTSAGSMTQWRAHHTATLLADGRVLVTGGIGNVPTTEFFDPATGVWSRGPDLKESRYDHTATLLNDGRVLVVAGQSTDNNLDRELSNSSEVWTQ